MTRQRACVGRVARAYLPIALLFTTPAGCGDGAEAQERQRAANGPPTLVLSGPVYTQVHPSEEEALGAGSTQFGRTMRITNLGQDTVRIQRVVTTCGCLKSVIVAGAAPPGSDLIVELFVSASEGIDKTVTAYISCDNGEVVQGGVQIHPSTVTRVWVSGWELDRQGELATLEVSAVRETGPRLPVSIHGQCLERSLCEWTRIPDAGGNGTNVWVARGHVHAAQGVLRIAYGQRTVGWVDAHGGRISHPHR